MPSIKHNPGICAWQRILINVALRKDGPQLKRVSAYIAKTNCYPNQIWPIKPENKTHSDLRGEGCARDHASDGLKLLQEKECFSL